MIFKGGSSPRTWGTQPNGAYPVHVERFIPTHVGNTIDRATPPTPSAVHPHARGEHPFGGRVVTEQNGSSPRTWRTLRLARLRGGGRRFIPTHVGNTRWHSLFAPASAVHPHARGEHQGLDVPATEDRGSSPRTWGTLVAGLLPKKRNRFIPTHVGNTFPRATAWAAMTVHPHARG